MKLNFVLEDTGGYFKEFNVLRNGDDVEHYTVYDNLDGDLPTAGVQLTVQNGGDYTTIELTGDEWRDLENYNDLTDVFYLLEDDPDRAEEIVKRLTGGRPVKVTYTYMEQRERYFRDRDEANNWVVSAVADGEIASGEWDYSKWYEIEDDS